MFFFFFMLSHVDSSFEYFIFPALSESKVASQLSYIKNVNFSTFFLFIFTYHHYFQCICCCLFSMSIKKIFHGEKLPGNWWRRLLTAEGSTFVIIYLHTIRKVLPCKPRSYFFSFAFSLWGERVCNPFCLSGVVTSNMSFASVVQDPLGVRLPMDLITHAYGPYTTLPLDLSVRHVRYPLSWLLLLSGNLPSLCFSVHICIFFLQYVMLLHMYFFFVHKFSSFLPIFLICDHIFSVLILSSLIFPIYIGLCTGSLNHTVKILHLNNTAFIVHVQIFSC